jgi:hypothetical protein
MAKSTSKGSKNKASEAFKFAASSKELEIAAVSAINAIQLQAKTISFFLMGRKKKLYVVAQDQGCFCCLEVPNANSEGDGIFSIDKDTLVGTIKNRAVINYEFTGTECLFKQAKGRYEGKLIIVPVTEEQSSIINNYLKEDVTSTAFSSETVKSILDGVAATAIKDVFNTHPILTVIDLKKSELNISSRASNHFAYFSTSLKSKSEFKIALPPEYFTTIDKICAGQDLELGMTKTQVSVKGKGFTLFLPAIQVEASEYVLVKTFIDGLKKSSFSCELDIQDLNKVVENLFTLYKEGGADFEVSTKAEVLKISLSAASGSASDQIKIKSKSEPVKGFVDPRLFKDVLGLAKSLKKPKMLVNDRVFMFKGCSDEGSVTIACGRATSKSKD